MTETRRNLLLASLAPFTLFVLLGVAANHGWFGTAELDAPSAGIRGWAAGQPWLEGPLFAVEELFATQGLTIATIAVVGWLLVRRQFRAGALVLVVMLAARELTQHTKELFGRDRPAWQDADFLHHAASYPSGHAAGVATFGGLVIVLTLLRSRGRINVGPVAAVVSVVVLIVCADRLLLGRHYLTDLIGGVLLATGLVLLGTALIHPMLGERREVQEAEKGATRLDDAPSVEKAEPVSRSA